jgi:hypothetical protein
MEYCIEACQFCAYVFKFIAPLSTALRNIISYSSQTGSLLTDIHAVAANYFTEYLLF